MPIARIKDIDIAYEIKGPKSAPTIMLIHGLGMPYIGWPQAFIDALLVKGFRLLLFDNRDVGLSSHMHHLGQINMTWHYIRTKIGHNTNPPYKLEDMMRDALRLLDALDIQNVHVVGASMGGMIAQLMAIHANDRIQSLTSVMSTTSNPSLPAPRLDVLLHLLNRPTSNAPEKKVEHGLKMWRMIGSPKYPTPEYEVINRLRSYANRGVPPEGIARQTVAIMSAQDRVPLLSEIDTPSLVIHGDSDPLVHPACGMDTAKSIKNSRLEIIPGMGHDLPDQLIPTLSDMITDHVLMNHQPPLTATLPKEGLVAML